MPKLEIIVAEADIEAALKLRTTLIQIGYHVMAIARTTCELIALARVCRPDLVITSPDLQGELDGIKAVEVVQSELYIPVVFITERSDSSSIARAKNAKPYGLVVRPYQDIQLQISIEIAIERYHAETKIKGHLDVAEKLKAFKSELISLISHEGRSPLTSILMSTDLLQRYSDNGTESQRSRCLSRIKAAVDHLNQLLEDVLDLNRSDANDRSLSLEPIELIGFCRQVIKEVTDHACEHNDDSSQVKLHSMELSRMFYTDIRILQHILQNLITNAVKYSPGQSPVDVYITCFETEVEIKVCDHGIGIPASDIPNLFTPFFRATNASGHQGIGLGLSIVKRFVESLAGKISVNSEEGKGSIFSLSLPIISSYPHDDMLGLTCTE
jgi:signal transduction histidine kinase